MPKGSKKRDRRPTPAELIALYKVAGQMNAQLPVFIELAVETVMRRSELLMLRCDQVRSKVAYLEDTKSGDRRAVPLSSRAIAVMERLGGTPLSVKRTGSPMSTYHLRT